MEKYLVIIILVVLAQYVHRYCIQIEIEKILKTKEGFAATSGSDADVASSINTLAQIAKDLQAGGINVPGNLNIKAAINTDGSITAKGAINASGGITCNAITSGPITSDTITAKGLVTATNGSRFTGDRHWFQDAENKGRLRVGAAWNIPGIYAEDGQHLVLGASSGNTHIGNPNENTQHLRINGDLSVKGHVYRDNPIYRKHDIAGYYSILEKGYKIPLYYGINMTMINWPAANTFRDNYKLPVNCAGLDLRYDQNGNFTNGNLVVFPSYKVKFYFWDRNGRLYSTRGSYGFGEHGFGGHPNAAHAIWVAYNEEPEPPGDLRW